MSFIDTLQSHLKAIKEHDIELFKTTLHPGREITCIEPNGEFIKSYQLFVDNQRDWFEDQSWTIDIEILNITETSDCAIATTKLTIREVEGMFQTILTLSFSKENGKWGLIHDQNTPVRNICC